MPESQLPSVIVVREGCMSLWRHEIPQEIAPVHVRELVVEEEVEVFAERRFRDRAGFAVGVGVDLPAAEIEHLAAHGASLRVAADFAVLVAQRLGLGAVGSPLFVLLFAFRVVPHAREEGHELRRMGVARQYRRGLVLAVLVQIPHCLFLHALGGSRVLRAVQQRAVAVLFAVEEREQRMGIVGVVGVHRRVGRGADHHRGIGGESHQDHRRREQEEVEQRTPPAVALPRGPAHESCQGECAESESRVDRKPQRIDEQRVELRPDPDRAGDDDVVDEDDQRAGDHG